MLYDNSCSIGNELISATTASTSKVPILDELYITGFDSEQIWQQIDHRFNVVTDESYIGELSKLLTDSSIGLDLNTDLTNGATESIESSDESDGRDLEDESDDDDEQSGDSDIDHMEADVDEMEELDEDEEDDEVTKTVRAYTVNMYSFVPLIAHKTCKFHVIFGYKWFVVIF